MLESWTSAPPAGAGALRVTVPVEDPRPPTTLDGFRVREEMVGRGIGLTVRVKMVLLCRLLEVPVILTAKVPVVADPPAEKVSVLVVVVGLGLNEALTPLGRPDAERLTLLLNPFCAVTVIVLAPVVP